MIVNPHMHQSMPLGVVVHRAPGATRWARWVWRAAAVLPGAGPADWQVLREEGGCVEYHAATPVLDLHGAETEAYLHGLSTESPAIYVVLRAAAGPDSPPEVLLVTASPYEAQDYCDSGEEIVEKVPMPDGLRAWIEDFVARFHEDEVFVKRRRDRQRIDKVEDGIGDPRIAQATDVYRAPRTGPQRQGGGQ